MAAVFVSRERGRSEQVDVGLKFHYRDRAVERVFRMPLGVLSEVRPQCRQEPEGLLHAKSDLDDGCSIPRDRREQVVEEFGRLDGRHVKPGIQHIVLLPGVRAMFPGVEDSNCPGDDVDCGSRIIDRRR